jgi:hypothetical protein
MYGMLGNSPGTYITVLNSTGGPNITYIIQINVTTDCLLINNGCPQNPLNIAWLNPTSGWSSYVFGGNKTLTVDIGQTETVKETNIEGDITTRKIGHKEIYDGMVVLSGHIPFAHLPLLKSLKFSTQAYLHDGNWWTIPILVDGSSFNYYKQNEGYYRYDFTFRYANEILIQQQ